MAYVIYWLISEDEKSTYVGFSDSIERRINEHRNREVRSTRYFGQFSCKVIEENINDEVAARKREKYWKSCAGRKRLSKLFGE